MKKNAIIFSMLLMLALTPSLVLGGRYNSLKFTSSTGETYTVATNNLEIIVNGENLTFSNTNLLIPLTSLVSMEFADFEENPAGIDAVAFDGKGIVTVYSINGTTVGSFESFAEAFSSLDQGLYVIKDSNGNSLKITVEK